MASYQKQSHKMASSPLLDVFVDFLLLHNK